MIENTFPKSYIIRISLIVIEWKNINNQILIFKHDKLIPKNYTMIILFCQLKKFYMNSIYSIYKTNIFYLNNEKIKKVKLFII